MQPGTTIPTRQWIARPLLDKMFEEERGKVEKLLNNQLCTLALDGWSTRVLQPVVGVAVTVNGNTYLFDTLDTSGQPHTTEYLVDVFKSQVEKVEEDWSVSVCFVVTDNASNMAGMRRLVKDPSALLHSYGCQAHHVNLLAKAIKDKLKNPLEKIVQVLKHLRNHHSESAFLREHCLPHKVLSIILRKLIQM